MPGTLYIVATPIGNLEDITLRALRILKECDCVAAEDTRHTRKLLAHFEIAANLVAYHQHSDEGQISRLIQRLTDGQNLALVTDAGTPGVSDPGVELVRAALDAGVSVVPIPGASAALCALVGSGLPPARFAFEGFLPRTKPSRRDKLRALSTETRTLIFYEAANRTVETLSELSDAFGASRPAAVCRELTKKFEEFRRGTLGELTAHLRENSPRGEVTIVVSGKNEREEDVEDEKIETVEDAVRAALRTGASERDAVRLVSEQRKQSRREVYAAMLTLKNARESVPPNAHE